MRGSSSCTSWWKARSAALLAPRSPSRKARPAAFSASSFGPFTLPLVSRTRIASTGVSSSRIGSRSWRRPSSRTSKSAAPRPRTGRAAARDEDLDPDHVHLGTEDRRRLGGGRGEQRGGQEGVHGSSARAQTRSRAARVSSTGPKR